MSPRLSSAAERSRLSATELSTPATMTRRPTRQAITSYRGPRVGRRFSSCHPDRARRRLSVVQHRRNRQIAKTVSEEPMLRRTLVPARRGSAQHLVGFTPRPVISRGATPLNSALSRAVRSIGVRARVEAEPGPRLPPGDYDIAEEISGGHRGVRKVDERGVPHWPAQLVAAPGPGHLE